MKYKKTIFISIIILLLAVVFCASRSDFLTNYVAKNIVIDDKILQKKESFDMKDFFYSIAMRLIEKNFEEQGIITNIQSQIFSDHRVQTETIQEGSGNPVFCGQIVKVDVVGHDEKKGNYLANHHDFELRLGLASLGTNVDYGILGMQKGEIREITVNSLQKDDVSHHKYKVVLHEILDQDNLNINDLIVLEQKMGIDQAAMCGDVVHFKFKMRNARNKVVFESDAIDTRLGMKNVPLSVELGLERAMKDTKRIVISPPEFFKADYYREKHNFDFELSENEIGIIEIDVLGVEKINK